MIRVLALLLLTGCDGTTGPALQWRLEPFESLRIEPADPVLVSVSGDETFLELTLVGRRADGSEEELPGATWSAPDERLGWMSPGGSFHANGTAGGQTTIEAMVTGADGVELGARTTLTVRTEWSEGQDSLPGNVIEDLLRAEVTEGGPPPREPLDGAVMPSDVGAPVVAWEGEPADVYRVELAKSHAVAWRFVPGDARSAAIGPAPWLSILESDPAEPITMRVDRYDDARGELVRGAPITVRIAQGRMLGPATYWDVANGRLIRVETDRGAREEIVPSPPGGCIGCHAVSADGGRLAAGVEESGGPPSPVLLDLWGDPPPLIWPEPEGSYAGAAFSPDTLRAIVVLDGAFHMIDPEDGTSISSSGLPASGATHPEWAVPLELVFIRHRDGDGIEYTEGDVVAIPHLGDGRFGAERTLHAGVSLAGAPEGGRADAHPTLSPDGMLLAFAHGPRSTARGRDGTAPLAPSSIYLLRRTEDAGPVRLEVPAADRAYWPIFLPVTAADEDGSPLYWLSYTSRAGDRRAQIWVTAIDPDDLSHRAPFLFPGQDPETDNVSLRLPASECREIGDGCSGTSDCCEGSCRLARGSETGRCEWDR